MKFNQGFGVLAVIITIAIIAALGGGTTYYVVKKAHRAPQASVSSSATTSVDVKGSSGTLRSLFALGKDVSCTISYASATSSSSGTVYISKSNFRGDFTMHSTSTGDRDAHVIKTEGSAYVWSGTQGAKISVGQLESSSGNVKSSSSFDMDQSVNYTCTPWTVDESKFTPPSNINFVDFFGGVQQQIKVKTNGSVNVCGVCDQLPTGPQRDQCKASMKCS